MIAVNSSKGKKRIYDESRGSSSSLSPAPPDLPKIKKSKRAETRQCPICNEPIPLRLLAAHAVLESQRVEEIIKQVGSTDILLDEPNDGPGPSFRNRKSAVKARKSLSAMNPRAHDPTDTLEQALKSIQTIKKHRKQRHAKFREMAREEEESSSVQDRWSSMGERVVCPVCSQTVRGDQDVLDAHVDACLAGESQRLEEERLRQQLLQRSTEDDDFWGETSEGGVGHIGNVRGTGFHTRDRHEQDVDDEVDIDGDDQAFGDAQFTEGDILPVDHPQAVVEQDVEVEIERDSEDEAQREQKTLRDLVAEGKIVRKATLSDRLNTVKEKMEEVMGVGDADKMDLAILAAQKRGDKSSLVTARLRFRNPCVYHRPLPSYAEYALTRTTNQPYPQAVGTRAVGSAGSVASAPQNSVPFANVSQVQQI